MNLQLFADGDAKKAVQGNKLIYLYRILSEAATEDAMAMAFVTENTKTKSRDAESTITKDGAIRTPAGASEVEISATSILAKGDELITKLENALDEGELIEIWEVNLEEPAQTSGKFKGTYYQGYLTEFEVTASAEEFVEIATTFGINGSGAKGDVTVSADQQAIATYVFKDTNAAGA